VVRHFEQRDRAIADLFGRRPATVRSRAWLAPEVLRLTAELQNRIHAEEES